MIPPVPLLSDLVLIGGGHSHVHILKMFGMKTSTDDLPSLISLNGIQTTLITCDIYTPYSGMLPGMVAGHYETEEILLDLRKLCRFGKVRLIHASAVGIRYNQGGGGWVECGDGRPDVRFDALSIDVGSSPSIPRGLKEIMNTKRVESACVTPVKPIAGFWARWKVICERFQSFLSHHSDKDDKNLEKHIGELVESSATQTTSLSNVVRVGDNTRTLKQKEKSPFILLIVGGGAGGIELALAAQFALKNILKKSFPLHSAEFIKVILVTKGHNLLNGHDSRVRKIFSRILTERKIEVRYGAEAIGVTVERIKFQADNIHDGMTRTLQLSQRSVPQPKILFDECLWCTSAGAPPWLSQKTPFATTNDGFLKVKDTYQLMNHPGVFAAGDCCDMVDKPRPKAGVFAVRAGPYVKENLIAYLLKKPLKSHEPQKEFLGLISTGNKYAVASRGDYVLEGEFLWTLKDQIDRAWMDGYKKLPSMEESDASGVQDTSVKAGLSVNENGQFFPPSLNARGPDAIATFMSAPMRCGGCGAKVGARTLTRVLDAVHHRRKVKARERSGHNVIDLIPLPKKIEYEDAAVVMLPKHSGGAMVSTIDFFRSFISDPFVFGKISAVHALSDCHAMGVKSHTALALAVVPFAAFEAITECTLIDMLSGANDILEEDGCDLSGGHTCEGAELAIGFSVNGYIENPSLLFRKCGGKVGDKIVLTKPIGTGAVFAADMRAKCKGEFVEDAISSMMISNGRASQLAMNMLCAREGQEDRCIHACTDVTGFGLVGHLLEMLLANNVDEEDNISATIDMNSVPFLQGALEASSDEIFSSLHRENYRSRRSIFNHEEAAKLHPIKYPLLFDPQTAGGLLFFVSPKICEEFVLRLIRDGGTNCAAVIGELVPCDNGSGACLQDMKNEEICSLESDKRLYINC